MYINFIEKDLIGLVKDQLNKNKKRIILDETSLQPCKGLIPKLNNLNTKLENLVINLNDIRMKNLLSKFIEDIIENSPLLKSLINGKKDVSISLTSGYVKSKKQFICKIEMSNIINRIADITSNNMYCVSNILINETDIYKPIINELNERKIVFDVELYCENFKYSNQKTKYYNNSMKVIEKINNFIDKYQVYDFFQCEYDFGKVKSNCTSEIIIINLSPNMEIILDEKNSLHKKNAFEILYSVNEHKRFANYKDFQKFIYKGFILKKKLIKIFKLAENKNPLNKDTPIRYILDDDSDEHFSILIENFYKDIKSSTDIKIKYVDFYKKSINEIIKIIMKNYYFENSDINSICSYQEFINNRKDILDNLRLMFY